MQDNSVLKEDEIDLRELFKTIWAHKFFILIFTLCATILAFVYVFIKTPIYEAKALIEIGEYRLDFENKKLIDNGVVLEKKLKNIFIEMEKNKLEASKITNISYVKGAANFLEIKSEAISNDEAKDKILEVLNFMQTEHQIFLDEIKKETELKLNDINLQISNIKTKHVDQIDQRIQNNKDTLKNLQEQLISVDANLKKIDTLNPSLAALKLIEKKDLTTSIRDISLDNFELEIKKDELLSTALYKLEERKKTLETLLLPHNYKNTQIVGNIITNDFPAKPKKKLIIAVAFMTGFILSIFLVFLREFILGLKKEI